MQSYEVWCHSCNVTFPAETRTCLHCGGRTRPERPRRTLRGSEVEVFAPTIDLGGGRSSGVPPFTDFSESPAEEAEPVRRSMMRAGMTFLWFVLIAGFTAWRACSQNAPGTP